MVTFQHDSFLWYVAWHPDARRLAIAASDRTIHLWDTVNNKRIRLWRTGANIRVGFNPAGEILASSGWEGYTRLWDSDSGRQLSGIQNHAGHLFGFDKEARRLALGGWDGLSLEILEVARGECLRSVYDAENPAGGGAGTPILNANGNLLAFRTQEGIGLWNSETMQLLSQLLGEQNQNDKAIIGFDASGTNLILSASEGLFRCQITVSSEQTPGFLGKPILVSTECADPVAGRMGWISAGWLDLRHYWQQSLPIFPHGHLCETSRDRQPTRHEIRRA